MSQIQGQLVGSDPTPSTTQRRGPAASTLALAELGSSSSEQMPGKIIPNLCVGQQGAPEHSSSVCPAAAPHLPAQMLLFSVLM